MNQGKKQKLMDAAIALVAESGMENFSMAKVAAKADSSERLVYNHFKTKDAFLESCFDQVNADLSALFAEKKLPNWEKADSTMQFIRTLWDLYFSVLVAGGEKTLFYFRYRNCEHISPEKKQDYSCFAAILPLVQKLDELYHIRAKLDEGCVQTYVLDCAGLFAERIIRGEWKDTPALRKNIWVIMSGGLRGMLQ